MINQYQNIEIHVSDYCNRNCSFCVSKNESGRGKQMSVPTAIVLANYLRELPVGAVTFSGGGEPTTNNAVLSYLIDELHDSGARCGLTTNGYITAANTAELDWVRLSVYSPNCMREVQRVLATRAKRHNAALFFAGMYDLRKYRFLLDYFDEVTVKTLNDAETPPLTDGEVEEIQGLGFKCKQNPVANDFAACKFWKPCFDTDGVEHKCCLCKAAGGFAGVEKCTVPCIMYNSNKQGQQVFNKYGFTI